MQKKNKNTTFSLFTTMKYIFLKPRLQNQTYLLHKRNGLFDKMPTGELLPSTKKSTFLSHQGEHEPG